MKDTFAFEGVDEAGRRGFENKSGHIRDTAVCWGLKGRLEGFISILWSFTGRHSFSSYPPPYHPAIWITVTSLRWHAILPMWFQ